MYSHLLGSNTDTTLEMRQKYNTRGVKAVYISVAQIKYGWWDAFPSATIFAWFFFWIIVLKAPLWTFLSTMGESSYTMCGVYLHTAQRALPGLNNTYSIVGESQTCLARAVPQLHVLTDSLLCHYIMWAEDTHQLSSLLIQRYTVVILGFSPHYLDWIPRLSFATIVECRQNRRNFCGQGCVVRIRLYMVAIENMPWMNSAANDFGDISLYSDRVLWNQDRIQIKIRVVSSYNLSLSRIHYVIAVNYFSMIVLYMKLHFWSEEIRFLRSNLYSSRRINLY